MSGPVNHFPCQESFQQVQPLSEGPEMQILSQKPVFLLPLAPLWVLKWLCLTRDLQIMEDDFFSPLQAEKKHKLRFIKKAISLSTLIKC